MKATRFGRSSGCARSTSRFLAATGPVASGPADNPADAWLVRHILVHVAGPALEVETVENGEEAMAYLQKQAPRYAAAQVPDLVLLDLNLPHKDGREVLREIRKDPALQRLPVVVLTFSDAMADVELCYQLQANAYVMKGGDLDDQTDALRTLHHYWFKVSRLPCR